MTYWRNHNSYFCRSFYSHASCEAWHFMNDIIHVVYRFYSHASCEAWPIYNMHKKEQVVSTHMPLARHDEILHIWQKPIAFLLTCLLRGMTPPNHNSENHVPFLLTCLLRGMTTCNGLHKILISFYSHASCEAWLRCLIYLWCQPQFLLTCLLRGMTEFRHIYPGQILVSTHMPLARHDPGGFVVFVKNSSFYSHASCEAWPVTDDSF